VPEDFSAQRPPGPAMTAAAPAVEAETADTASTALVQARITTRFFLQVLLLWVPFAAALSLLHSSTVSTLVGGAVAIGATLLVPKAGALRFFGVALVAVPESITVTNLGGSPVTLKTALFLLLALATFAAAMRGRLHLRSPAPLLMTVLVVAGVLGVVDNNRSKSVLEFFVLIALPPIVGATLGADRSAAVELLRGLTAGTLLVILFALYESLTNHNYLISQEVAANFVRADHVRATGGMAFPTYLGAFLALGGFFVIHTMRNRWKLLGLVAGGALVTAAMIATQARSGLLGLAAGALVYLLLQRRASQGLGVLVGLGFAVLLMLMLPGGVPSSFRSFLSESLTPGSAANSNVNYRQVLYSDAHAAMAHQPWFGYGYGSGKSVAVNELHTYFGSYTDLASLPVSLAVQLGYVGTAALILLLLKSLVRIARARELPERLPLAAGLVGCAVAMMGVPVSPPLSWMLLLIGMGTILAEKRPTPDDETANESQQLDTMTDWASVRSP
jgi:O-antigen ligase